MRVLVTGGAGFIGSAVVDALHRAGHDVIALDAFIPQAHGTHPDADAVASVIRCDVRDAGRLRTVLSDVDVVCHQAAMVGAGVTARDLPDYAAHNDLGTAVLLATMAATTCTKLVLASSMVVYGDGRYTCGKHGEQPATRRTPEDLQAGRFHVGCPVCGQEMSWLPVSENAALSPRSSYAASKVAQEHYVAAWARQTGGCAVALRYHNVYGPGMPADTPYSGVAAMFRSALERGDAPRVFEDGRQMRDFVHVADVATCNVAAVEAMSSRLGGEMSSYNVCSGQPISISDVASMVSQGAAGPPVQPVITGEYRLGDVRHIVASPDRARAELGFAASVQPASGLARFAQEPLRTRTPATRP